MCKTRNQCTERFCRAVAPVEGDPGQGRAHRDTRLAPTIRYGIPLLQQQKAAQQRLLVISDGKPIDDDRYESCYGIADVRQAIREAGQVRMHLYALAVDTQAKVSLPEVFSAGHYQLLPHPSRLVYSLAQLYTRLWY